MECRLVFNDAATYNIATNTGGLNGSIILSKEEASRPENADLSDYVAKLAQAKKVIDEGGEKITQGPISWSDLMVLAARVAVRKQWLEVKVLVTCFRMHGGIRSMIQLCVCVYRGMSCATYILSGQKVLN